MQEDAQGDADDDTLAVTEDNLAGCLGELSTPDKPSCFPHVAPVTMLIENAPPAHEYWNELKTFDCHDDMWVMTALPAADVSCITNKSISS